MKTLVVDDSATIRTMLRRALSDFPPIEITEAPNGLEALAEIARQRFDLVILDVNMPVMDGLETLETIRSSPAHASLPVVVLTTEKNDAVVRRLVELGITDYLSKPLSRDNLSDRLSRSIKRLREPAAVHRKAWSGNASQRVLVVEQDPDRRHFLVTVLAARFETLAADSAAAALRMCMDPNEKIVDIVLVGAQIGLPSVNKFVPKLRALPSTTDACLLTTWDRSGAMDDGTQNLFDGIVEWANVPEVFLARFERAANGADAPSGLPAFRLTLERDAVRAMEQLFGMMLSSEAVPVEPEATPIRSWPGTGAHSRIDLQAAEGSSVSILFRADAESARLITAHLLGASADDVHEDDIMSTAAEFVNIIVGRLRNRMVESGLHTRMQLPTTWVGSTPEEFQKADVALTFDSTTLGASFGLLLRVTEGAGS